MMGPEEWQRGEAAKALQRLIDSPEPHQIPAPAPERPSLAERQAAWRAEMDARYARWDEYWDSRGGKPERDRIWAEMPVTPSPVRPESPPYTYPYPPPPYQRESKPRGSSRKAIPQSIKVAVAARDGGRCQCRAGICGHRGMCGSTEEPHYDHIIPWSKGGMDTVDNLQILCGPCNRRKGADDIT